MLKKIIERYAKCLAQLNDGFHLAELSALPNLILDLTKQFCIAHSLAGTQLCLTTLYAGEARFELTKMITRL